MSFCFIAVADIGSELLELPTALSYWGYIFKTGRRNPLILELFTPLPLQYLISDRGMIILAFTVCKLFPF